MGDAKKREFVLGIIMLVAGIVYLVLTSQLPRKQAIDAAVVSRADVLVNLPTCHRKNCQAGHGDIDLVFRM